MPKENAPIKAAVIINTHSRKGQQLFFESMDLLKKEGIIVEDSYPVMDPKLLHDAVKDSIEKGYKLIIVGGGDGTLSSVVKYFAHKNVTMGVLPLGTGNSFARSLELPLNLPDVIKVIANGKVAKINLGQIGDNYFANVASIGFNARVAKDTPDQMKKYLGFFAYGLVGLKLFIGKPSFKCEMTINKDKIEGRLNQLVIANGSFFGITKIYPEAHIDNNELSVIAINSTSRWQIVKSWTGFMIGKPKMFKGVNLYSAQQVTIQTSPQKTVDIDGEALFKTPIKISMSKEALQVMVPHNFQDKK